MKRKAIKNALSTRFIMEVSEEDKTTHDMYIYDQIENQKPSITLANTIGFPKITAGTGAKCFLGAFGNECNVLFILF